MALGGLVMVVWQSLLSTSFNVAGLLFALAALACITTGALLQKRIKQSPLEVLPLQYAVTVSVCLLFA